MVEIFSPLMHSVESALHRSTVSGLTGSAKALFVVLLSLVSKRPVFFLTPKNEDVQRASNDIRCFSRLLNAPANVIRFPALQADYYRRSPHPEICEERSFALWNLLYNKPAFVVASLEAVVFRIPSPREFARTCKMLTVNQEYAPEQLIQDLTNNGYIMEDPVTNVGELSQRGGILDLFSPNYENPIRIEFFGDSVDSIRSYDAGTQRSLESRTSVQIIPMREFCPSKDELQRWAAAAADTWTLDKDDKYVREKLSSASQGNLFPGYESLVPLIHPLESSIFDYLANFILFIDEPDLVITKAEELVKGLRERCEEVINLRQPGLPPEKLILTFEELRQYLSGTQTVESREIGILDGGADSEIIIRTQQVRKYHGTIKSLVEDIEKSIADQETILFLLSNIGRAERVSEILRDYELPAANIWNNGQLKQRGGEDEILTARNLIAISPISSGFYIPEIKLRVFSTADLFDEVEVKPAPQRNKTARAVFFSDLRDLRQNDYVVHVDHGIGQFQGLSKITVGNEIKEFMLLTYRDGDRVYVPVENLDLVQKYRGVGSAKPSLDKLGGISWSKTKARIKKSMQDLAEELLQLYAQRNIVTGFAFSADDHWQIEFEDGFEFEETPDQALAVSEMKRDMESPRPMDRLICGDVGYGKTEVAMRGAFKAVLNGKQVAVLTPTTVLAFQHHNTFKTRFQGFPVKIEMLSRFKNKKEQKQILEELENGSVDIIIGTHRLLSSDVKFRDIGLVIIDEEQRFGVRQKERLKKFKTQVDVLSLSATPIPRTLHMALVGLRDMSVIETPPKDRLAIQTLLVRFDKNIIKSAIDTELMRRGQVYFVHNRIDSIYSIATMIRELSPEARIAIAHGQMRERELEKIMLDFIEHKFDVLLSTTIIENGLDIPLVNTIIIDHADSYGLAELYQLRGRVGRSDRPAYAYLLVPPDDALSEVARKRLAAIREFSELGSGFHLAGIDLEIRGAGNLLGGQQHGHINAIGFELYCRLLENTIRKLKGESLPAEIKTSIDLNLDIHIPEEYIQDANQRMRVYKKIASAEKEEDLELIRSEMIDRYGKHPIALSNLFDYARLRLTARRLLVSSIERSENKIYIRFSPQSPVSSSELVQLVSKNRDLSFSPDGILAIPPRADGIQPIEIRDLLEQLTRNAR